MKGEKSQKKIIGKKVKNLWIIDREILKQLKDQKSATSREMSSLLDYPTSKRQPSMSYILQRMRSSKLLRYNKKNRKYSLTELGKNVEKKIKND